jgi:hypothetical protein
LGINLKTAVVVIDEVEADNCVYLSGQINLSKINEMIAKSKDYVLKEPPNPYNRVFAPEKDSLRLKSEYFWQALP